MIQPIITDINDVSRLPDSSGIYFFDTVKKVSLFLPLWYGNRLDLDKMLVYSGEDAEEHPELKDYNDLIREGRIEEKTIYREWSITPKCVPNRFSDRHLSMKCFNEIIEEFRAHGFNVTVEGLRHNYSCWLGDLKSGYRDEKNGYHLFTPCGCNPLEFRATSLDSRLDWQTTYEY